MSHSNVKDALKYHSKERAGKIEIMPTKPANSAEDIALAYSPGALFPATSIGKERWNAYRYTNKGNLVGILSDGVDSLATKPLMESKSMLMKRLADIDAFDIEITPKSDETLLTIIQSIAPTFGGISLGGIKSKEGVILQKKLQQLVGIPVLCDDAYGTAVAIAAIFKNHLKLCKKRASEMRIALIGNNSTAQATVELLAYYGIESKEILSIDSIEKTESSIIDGCNFVICSDREKAPTPDILHTVASDAVIIILSSLFDCKEIINTHPHATLFTGDIRHKNYIDSILVTPYIFRGALDTLSTSINSQMIKAAIESLASLGGDRADEPLLPRYNDKRLATTLATAVAAAAIESGIARRSIGNWKEYRQTLLSRLERIYNMTVHIKHYGKNNQHLHRRYSRSAPEY